MCAGEQTRSRCCGKLKVYKYDQHFKARANQFHASHESTRSIKPPLSSQLFYLSILGLLRLTLPQLTLLLTLML
jgi:hypothetical protein